MSKTSPSKDYVEETRKLLYWMAQWPKEGENFEAINFDIPELSVLLQCMGFGLESLEKVLDVEKVPIVPKFPISSENHVLRIDLTCTTSGMRSALIKQTYGCKCPSDEQAAEGQFWSVTGCGPSSQTSINSSNSSLLPTLTSAKAKIVNHLMAKIFNIINETESNQTGKPRPELTRHRSLDTLRSEEAGNPFPKMGLLKRGPSWEVDSKTSPHTGTSSPVTVTSSSLSQISLDLGKQNVIVKNLEAIKNLVMETMEIASGDNTTFVKPNNNIKKKRVLDIKSAESSSVSDLNQLQLPSEIEHQTPRKKLTPKKLLGSKTGERKGLIALPKQATLRKKALVGLSTSPVSPMLYRKDTSKPKSKLIKPNTAAGGSYENIFRSKIATNLGTRPKLSPSVGGTSQPGTSGIGKFTRLAKRTAVSTTVVKKDK